MNLFITKIKGTKLKRSRYETQRSTYTDQENIYQDLNLCVLQEKYLCDVLKRYIQINHNLLYVMNINDGWRKQTHKLINERDLLESSYLKINEFFNISIKKNISQEQIIKSKDTIIKSQQFENKNLRKKIKQMETMLSNMTFNPLENSDESEEDMDDNSDEMDIDEMEPQQRTTDKILETYQSIKDYMIQKNMSLSILCKNNNMNIKKFAQIFVNLKCLRIEKAHPQSLNISTDSEFFKILTDF